MQRRRKWRRKRKKILDRKYLIFRRKRNRGKYLEKEKKWRRKRGKILGERKIFFGRRRRIMEKKRRKTFGEGKKCCGGDENGKREGGKY